MEVYIGGWDEVKLPHTLFTRTVWMNTKKMTSNFQKNFIVSVDNVQKKAMI